MHVQGMPVSCSALYSRPMRLTVAPAIIYIYIYIATLQVGGVGSDPKYTETDGNAIQNIMCINALYLMHYSKTLVSIYDQLYSQLSLHIISHNLYVCFVC